MLRHKSIFLVYAVFVFFWSCSEELRAIDRVSEEDWLAAQSSSSVSYVTVVPCDNTREDDGSVTCEGQSYKTVKIGEQTWMAENLNHEVEGSWCIEAEGDGVNMVPSGGLCHIHGHLYNWAAAMNLSSICNTTNCSEQIKSPHRGICPEGWHIPSNTDWNILFVYVDGLTTNPGVYSSPTAGRDLKDSTGWNLGNPGINKYGFSALPGGIGYPSGTASYAGELGYWWSAKESNAGNASGIEMKYNSDGARWVAGDKTSMLSVRCIKDKD